MGYEGLFRGIFGALLRNTSARYIRYIHLRIARAARNTGLSSSLFEGDIGLFMISIGLFMIYIGLFMIYIGLFWRTWDMDCENRASRALDDCMSASCCATRQIFLTNIALLVKYSLQMLRYSSNIPYHRFL